MNRILFTCICSQFFLANSFAAGLPAFVEFVIRDEVYRRELELTDQQLDQLKDLTRKGGEQRLELAEQEKAEYDRLKKEVAEKGLRVNDAMQQQFITFQEELWKKRLNEILVKSQMKRLEQLMRRTEAASHGFTLPLQFADELGLAPEEIATLRTAITERQIRHEELMARTQERLYNKMVEGLPDDIRQRYLQLVGERFDFDRFEKELAESKIGRVELIKDAFEIKKAEGDPPANKQP